MGFTPSAQTVESATRHVPIRNSWNPTMGGRQCDVT
jgi:hypothetical protein